jgi:hypothetical protein
MPSLAWSALLSAGFEAAHATWRCGAAALRRRETRCSRSAQASLGLSRSNVETPPSWNADFIPQGKTYSPSSRWWCTRAPIAIRMVPALKPSACATPHSSSWTWPEVWARGYRRRLLGRRKGPGASPEKPPPFDSMPMGWACPGSTAPLVRWLTAACMACRWIVRCTSLPYHVSFWSRPAPSVRTNAPHPHEKWSASPPPSAVR